MTEIPDSTTTSTSSETTTAAARQLLGMKGAKSGETNIWKIRLQLMKPITWIPLMWVLSVALHRREDLLGA